METTAAAPPAGTTAHGAGVNNDTNVETVQTINLGFVKLKVHRQTARQAALLAQQQTSLVALTGNSRTPGPGNLNPLDQGSNTHAPERLLQPEMEDMSQVGCSDVADSRSNSRPTAPASLANSEPAPGPRSHEELLAHWNTWEQAGGTTGGNRTEAVNKMRLWLDQNTPDEPLVLSSLGLTSLPQYLPDSLQWLHVRDNQLSALPENLPTSLLNLNAIGNPLTNLPAHLPAALQGLDVQSCQLSALPESLPVSLRALDVSNNRLRSLPENIMTRLGRGCEVELYNNPLSERVREHLGAIVCARGYQGPRFFFSMASTNSATAARPLADAVANWYEAGDHNAVRQTWQSFSKEEGAVSFSKFLDRLSDTVNSGNPQFNQATAQWLSHLAKHAALRNDTFLISEDATTSCEDRVSLTFNDMKKARLSADVEGGDYDQKLPDLMDLARGMFRLDKLEKIARDKVASLRLVDEVEVYLAYQVQLRDRLDLPLDTPDMRFFGASFVTPEDLDQAEQGIQAAEGKEFFHYLSSEWGPWQSVLKRLNPEAHAAAKEKLIEDLAGNEFELRLNAKLEVQGLKNNSDARLTLGAQVRAEMIRETNGALTREFLNKHGLSDLAT